MTELKSLGKQTPHVHIGADPRLLEKAPNPMKPLLPSGAEGTVTIRGDEFSSLCPVTGGPDYAEIVVEYTPRDFIVESKSFKLYMGSFRQEPIFHEKVAAKICKDLVELLDPAWLKVTGNFKARGGWAIIPVTEWYHPDA
jgi:7-cyano-7-deazaguanine reductase